MIHHETRTQLLRFLVIGTSSVLCDLTVFVGLTALGMPGLAAKGCSFLAGMVLGFFGNKLWTFRSARRSISEPATYLALFAATLVLNIACYGAAGSVLASWLSEEAARLAAFLFATGVTTVCNFVGLRLITFREGIRERLAAEQEAH